VQVQKVSFTSAYSQNQQAKEVKDVKERDVNPESSFYNKENFMQIGAISDFLAGSGISFGVLEAINKRSLVKKVNIIPAALEIMAKKATKRNILLALGIGGLYSALDLYLSSKLLPKIEKSYDKLANIDKNANVKMENI